MATSTCIYIQVLPNLTNKKRQRVEELQRKVAENEDARTMSVAMRGDNPSDRSKDTKVIAQELRNPENKNT